MHKIATSFDYYFQNICQAGGSGKKVRAGQGE